MNEVLIQTGYFVLSYAGLIILIVGVLNFFTKGFILAYLRVKPSKGKKFLIFAKSRTDLYVAVGLQKADGIQYTSNTGDTQTYPEVASELFFSAFGVWCLYIDEPKRKILAWSDGTKGDIDPNETDKMLQKSIDLPRLASYKENIVLYATLGVLFMTVIIAFMAYTALGKLDQIYGFLQMAGVI